MDFFCPFDPVCIFTAPKHPEQLYEELPTERCELIEWITTYYSLLIQSVRVQDEAQAHLAQQALYHVQYRLIKLKVYHESSDFVEQYERELPYMVWNPESVPALPDFLTSKVIPSSSQGADQFQEQLRLLALTRSFGEEIPPLEEGRPSTPDYPYVDQDEYCSRYTRYSGDGPSEQTPMVEITPCVEQTPSVKVECSPCVVGDSEIPPTSSGQLPPPVSKQCPLPRKRSRRGKGSRTKALKKYLLHKVASESPQLGEQTFSSFEYQMDEKRSWVMYPGAKKSRLLKGRRPLTAREEETQRQFKEVWTTTQSVSVIPELNQSALRALERVTGIPVQLGRDFVLWQDRLPSPPKDHMPRRLFNTSHDWGPRVTRDLQTYLESSRFSAYYY